MWEANVKLEDYEVSNLSVHQQTNGKRRCGTYIQWDTTQS